MLVLKGMIFGVVYEMEGSDERDRSKIFEKLIVKIYLSVCNILVNGVVRVF